MSAPLLSFKPWDENRASLRGPSGPTGVVFKGHLHLKTNTYGKYVAGSWNLFFGKDKESNFTNRHSRISCIYVYTYLIHKEFPPFKDANECQSRHTNPNLPKCRSVSSFFETRPVTLFSLVHLDDHLDLANQLTIHHVAPIDTLGCPLMNETDIQRPCPIDVEEVIMTGINGIR